MSSYNPYDQLPYQQQQQFNQQHQHYNNNNHHHHQPTTTTNTNYHQPYPQQYQQPHHYQPQPTLNHPPQPPLTPQTPYDPYYYQQQQQYPQQPSLPPQPLPLSQSTPVLPLSKKPAVITQIQPPVQLHVQPNTNVGRYNRPSGPPSPTRRNPRHPSPHTPSLPHHHQQHFHPYKNSRPPHPTPPPPFPNARPKNVPARYQTPRNQPQSRHTSSRNVHPPSSPSVQQQTPTNPRQNSASKSGKNPIAEVVREALAMFIHRDLITRTPEDQKAILESPESLTKEFKNFIKPAVFEEAKRKLSGKNGGPDFSLALQSSPEYAALLGDAKTIHHTFHSALATARHSTLGTNGALTPNKRAIETLGESWDSVKLAKLEAKEAKRMAAIKNSDLTTNNGEHATKNGNVTGVADGTAGVGNAVGSTYGENSIGGIGGGKFSRRGRSPRDTRNCNNEPVATVPRKKRMRESERKTDAEGNDGEEDATSMREKLAAARDAVLRAEAATEAAREQGRVRVERLCAALENRDAARAERDESRLQLEAFRKAVDEYLPIEVKSKFAQDEREREVISSSSVAAAAAEKEELKIEIRHVREILDELRSEASSLANQRDSLSRMMMEIQAEETRARMLSKKRNDTLLPAEQNEQNAPLPSSTTSSSPPHAVSSSNNESVVPSSEKEPGFETNCARLNGELAMDLVEKNGKGETDTDNTVSPEERNRSAEGSATRPEGESEYGNLFTLDYEGATI